MIQSYRGYMSESLRLQSGFFSGIILLIGLSFVVWSMVAYYLAMVGSLLTTEQGTASLENLAYLSLFVLLFGLGLCGIGVVKLLSIRRGNDQQSSAIMAQLSFLITQKRYWSVSLLCAILYGIFFSIVSGILVYQPAITFSRGYGVKIPSVLVVTCCGSFGQIPEFAVYLSEHVGLLIAPLNLVIMFVVSWLVGFNAGMVRLGYDVGGLGAKRGWAGIMGAGIGPFTACPTCASFFLSSILGASGAFSVVLGLSWLQGILIVSGLSFLVAGPVLTARRIISLDNCSLWRK